MDWLPPNAPPGAQGPEVPRRTTPRWQAGTAPRGRGTDAAPERRRGGTVLIVLGVCLAIFGVFVWQLAQAHNPYELSTYVTESWVLSRGGYLAALGIAVVSMLGGVASFVIGLVRR